MLFKSTFCDVLEDLLFLEFFNNKIPIYGLLFYFGIILAVTFAFALCNKRGLPAFEISYSAVFCMIGAIIGAKLLFVVVSYKQILTHNLTFISIIKGGFIFYGGLLGGIIGLLIYTTVYKMNFFRFSDVFSTVLPLGHAFGRVGCYFAGCCYGLPYNGPFARIYNESVGLTPLNIPLFPIQLLEALCLFILFIALLVVYFKSKKYGFSTSVYLMLYSVLRFIIEFFRGDKERGVFMGFSTSQYISVIIFIIGILLLLHTRNKQSLLTND